jgi:hypothetical protein
VYKLDNVSNSIYRSILKGNVLLIEHEKTNRYWILKVNNKIYGFTTDSTIMIDPIIECFKSDNIIFIGIHDFVVAISTVDGNIKFLSGLQDPFTEVKRIDLGYLIVCETGMLKINEDNFSIGGLISLPDVIEDYKIYNGKITIVGVTGEVFEIPFL